MISFVLERRLIAYSGVVLIIAFVLVFMLGFYTARVSAVADNRYVTSLNVPAAEVVNVVSLRPDPYNGPPTDEFIDAGLPGEQKIIEQISDQNAQRHAVEEKPDKQVLVTQTAPQKQAEPLHTSVYSLQLGMFRDKTMPCA